MSKKRAPAPKAAATRKSSAPRRGTPAKRERTKPKKPAKARKTTTRKQDDGRGNGALAPTSARSAMEIVSVPAGDLRPNPWNVNRMGAEIEHKLTEYIRREGLVEPIVVRPHPTERDRFEILGGFHRWKICKEKLGYEVMPCVVVDVDDKRAKILSINLNEMSGESVPALLSELLHDLTRDTAVDDLETLLPYDAASINDSLDLLKLPDGLDRMLEEEAKKEEAEAPTILSFVLDKQQVVVVERAMEHAIGEIGAVKNRKGRALELMAAAYLRDVGEPVAPDEPQEEGKPRKSRRQKN